MTIFWQMISLGPRHNNRQWCFMIWISLKFDPMDVSDNQTALVQLMASHRSGDKQLSEPLFATLTDVDMQNRISMHMYHKHTSAISIRNVLATSLDYGWYGCGEVTMGLLPDTRDCGLPMRRECQKSFHRHRGLAIPTCITARAWRTGRDAYRYC